MIDNGQEQVERRAYQRGYTAGRKKAVAEALRASSRYDQFLAAAMTGLLASSRPWSLGGKPDTSPQDYAVTAHQIALAMLKKQP